METVIGLLSAELAATASWIEYTIRSSGVPPNALGLILIGLAVWFLIGRTAAAVLRGV